MNTCRTNCDLGLMVSVIEEVNFFKVKETVLNFWFIFAEIVFSMYL